MESEVYWLNREGDPQGFVNRKTDLNWQEQLISGGQIKKNSSFGSVEYPQIPMNTNYTKWIINVDPGSWERGNGLGNC